MNVMTPKFGMGASVLRKEDDAFIRGAGRYTDDLHREGMLHGYVLRSPVASGTFAISSVEEARNAPGVHLVLTAADIGHLTDLKGGGMQKQPDGSFAPTRDLPVLCRDRVRHVGDAVAFIVADTRALAQDAAELIEIDFEPDDAIAETGRALDDDVPLVWPEAGSNKAFTYQLGDPAAAEAAFAKAARVSRIEFVNNRVVSNYMEPRSAVGEWKQDEDRFELVTGSQGVFSMRRVLAGIFGIGEDKFHVLTHDVGGGFGTKMFVYREYPLVLEAAKRLGRPVKWTSDRAEHFLADAQGRDNVQTAEMAMDENGRFLALRVRTVANMGAYTHQFGGFIPHVGATMSTGVYDIPALDVSIKGVYTHTVPVDAYRGAGRPEAAFLVEKLVDQCARDLGVAPDEIRRRNFIGRKRSPIARRPAATTMSVNSRATWNSRWSAPAGRASTSGWPRPRPKARSAASAWRPMSRPAPSPARRPCI